MWTYEQKSGELRTPSGVVLATGYSGAGEGKNNPDMQEIHNVGPIPRGFYTIGHPFDSREHGPHTMHLMPSLTNCMFGRGGFLIHGDSIEHPGAASEGCIILPRNVREKVSASLDTILYVTF